MSPEEDASSSSFSSSSSSSSPPPPPRPCRAAVRRRVQHLGDHLGRAARGLLQLRALHRAGAGADLSRDHPVQLDGLHGHHQVLQR